MQYELWILIAATALGLVHLSMESFSFKMQVGNSYTVGPRDTTIAREGLAGRCYRAYRNFQETYPIFAVLVLVVYSTDSTGQLSQWGTTLYIAGRIAYLPLYIAGIRWIRSIVWKISTFGILLVGAELFL